MSTGMKVAITIFAFLYGIIIGSFSNVCIERLPTDDDQPNVGLKELLGGRSKCTSCGYQLKWYDILPVFSYIYLKGKCRKCGEKISRQYPLVELVNGLMYMVIFGVNGYNIMSVIYCLFFSALLILTVIDWRNYYIPVQVNWFILILGIIGTVVDYKNIISHIIGAFSISLLIYIIIYLSDGRAFGGGDCKLMAAAGLLVGWKLVVLAFFLSCILGAVIHSIRMRVSNEQSMLAMGPYLSAGLLISILCGNGLINWYLSVVF